MLQKPPIKQSFIGSIKFHISVASQQERHIRIPNQSCFGKFAREIIVTGQHCMFQFPSIFLSKFPCAPHPFSLFFWVIHPVQNIYFCTNLVFDLLWVAPNRHWAVYHNISWFFCWHLIKIICIHCLSPCLFERYTGIPGRVWAHAFILIFPPLDMTWPYLRHVINGERREREWKCLLKLNICEIRL